MEDTFEKSTWTWWILLFAFWVWVLAPPQSKEGRGDTEMASEAIAQCCRLSFFHFSLNLTAMAKLHLVGPGCFPLLFSQRSFSFSEPLSKKSFDSWILGTLSSPQVPEEADTQILPLYLNLPLSFPKRERDGCWVVLEDFNGRRVKKKRCKIWGLSLYSFLL